MVIPSQGSYKGCSQQKMIGESHTRLEKLLVKAFSFTSSTVEATTTNKGISATKADHYFCKYRRQRLLVLFSTAALIDIPELSPLTHFYRSKSSVFSCLTSSNWIQHYQQTNKKRENIFHWQKSGNLLHTFFVTETIICCMFPKHGHSQYIFGISRNSCRWMRGETVVVSSFVFGFNVIFVLLLV